MKTTMTAVAALFAYAGVIAYDNGPSWKKDADGKIETDSDGNPILLTGDGREQSVKTDTIPNLQNEAKTHRVAKENAENRLKEFGDFKPDQIDDARKAMQTVKDLDDKKLMDAGQVEELRTSIKASYQKQIDEATGENTKLRGKIDNMLIADVFKGSDYINQNIAVPVDMFRMQFEKNFKVEDGKVIPIDQAGNRLLSKQNVGENASVEEAFSILVDGYSQKDAILKAPDQRGSGSGGDGGNLPPGQRTMKSADFDKLSPAKQSEIAMKGEIQIVD